MSLEFAWVSATVLVFGTLVLAGQSHLRNADSLSTALRLRFRTSLRSSRGLAKLVGFYELAIGSTGLVAAVTGSGGLLRLLTGAALVTYAIYTWYVWSIHARGMDAPCGCTSDDAPANGGTVARTLALAVAAAIAFVIGEMWIDPWTVPGPPVVMLLMGVLAGATFMTLLWSLPSAVAVLPPKAAGGRVNSRIDILGEER